MSESDWFFIIDEFVRIEFRAMFGRSPHAGTRTASTISLTLVRSADPDPGDPTTSVTGDFNTHKERIISMTAMTNPTVTELVITRPNAC
jgi:hypothetical protein